ncbi:MAG: hypothetical protein Q8P97_00435 [bacterium]|nr:hypothetical protein [bacterium]
MKIHTLSQLQVTGAQEVSRLRYPLPSSWTAAAGILKGKKRTSALQYQKQMRKEWEKRLRASISNLSR